MQSKDDNNLRFSRDVLSLRRGLLYPVVAIVIVAFSLQSAWAIISDAGADLRLTKRFV